MKVVYYYLFPKSLSQMSSLGSFHSSPMDCLIEPISPLSTQLSIKSCTFSFLFTSIISRFYHQYSSLFPQISLLSDQSRAFVVIAFESISEKTHGIETIAYLTAYLSPVISGLWTLRHPS